MAPAFGILQRPAQPLHEIPEHSLTASALAHGARPSAPSPLRPPLGCAVSTKQRHEHRLPALLQFARQRTVTAPITLTAEPATRDPNTLPPCNSSLVLHKTSGASAPLRKERPLFNDSIIRQGTDKEWQWSPIDLPAHTSTFEHPGVLTE